MKLNLNFQLKDLTGKPIESEPIAKIFANALAASQSNDPLKIMHIAQTLYNKGEIDLDISDLEMLINEVKSSKAFTNILQAQILEAIDNAKMTK